MSFSSRKETHDFYPPSGSSSSTSINGVLHHRSSKATIQSHQESISNFSVHTATAAIHKDVVDLSGEEGSLPFVSHHLSNSSSDRVPSISDHQKSTFESQNQSLSTVCSIREPKSNHSFTPTFRPGHKFRSLNLSSLEDEAESSRPSTSRTSLTVSPTLMTDPSPSPVYAIPPSPPLDDGDFDTFANIGTPTADAPTIRPASFFPRPDRMGTTWRLRSGNTTAKGKKRMLDFMTHFFKSNKRLEISTPHNPLHLTHVGLDSSTREFTGLPEDWRRPLQDSGISKSAQEKGPLSVMEVVKFCQEGGGDVWDRMGHAPAPGSSRSPSIPGAVHAAYPGVSKTVGDSRLPTLALSPPKISRSSDDPQSTSHLGLTLNDRTLGDQRSAPKLPPHSDKDRHFPTLLAYFFFF